MERLRGIRHDRVSAWLMAGLVAYVLLLQGLVTAYAKGTMAADSVGPVFVICSPSGTADQQPDHPLADLTKECCSNLCQSACAAGPAVPPASETAFEAPVSEHAWSCLVAPRAPPAATGLVQDARAPPAFSI